MHYLTQALIVTLSLIATAQAGSFEGPNPAASNDEYNKNIGKSFWIFYSSSDDKKCDYAFSQIRPSPDVSDIRRYKSNTPVKATILAVVQTDHYQTSKFYKLQIGDTDSGYTWATTFTPPTKTDLSEYDLTSPCFLAISPEERTSKLEKINNDKQAAVAQEAKERAIEEARLRSENEKREALSKKPGARIGMSAKQVRESTSWGEPEKINRTTSARGTYEQWVYGVGNYLYFRNGKLVTIQN
jgi:hypothetical protein